MSFFDPNLRIKNDTTGLPEDFKKYFLSRKIILTKGEKHSTEALPNLSKKTVKSIIMSVTTPLKEAKRLGLIRVNPADALTKLKKPKKPEVF